jgi:hypothetical protein
MKKATIRKRFLTFRGAVSFAALRLSVNRSTVSRWLKGEKASARLDAEMPALARELEQTQGACMKSARVGVTQFRKRFK